MASLLDAGYTVYALNHKSVERYRGRARTSGAKTDPADAELLARILLTDRDRHRPVLPNSPTAEELRSLARDDERAARDQRRLLNRLRQDLLDVFPQALIALPDLAAPTALAFLARWPSAAAARHPPGRTGGLLPRSAPRLARPRHPAGPRRPGG